jgi:putative NADH-flavin reductase
MTRIAIIGGHGKVARELSKVLAADGQEVTAIFRNPKHTADVAATGATPVVLDVENATTAEIAEALSGHDAVVWSAGAGGGNPARTYAVDRDAAMRSMDAAWTILGTGALTDKPGSGLIDVHVNEPWQAAETARANVALVAAAVLELPAAIGRTIAFRDGSEPIAAALAAVA